MHPTVEAVHRHLETARLVEAALDVIEAAVRQPVSRSPQTFAIAEKELRQLAAQAWWSQPTARK